MDVSVHSIYLTLSVFVCVCGKGVFHSLEYRLCIHIYVYIPFLLALTIFVVPLDPSVVIAVAVVGMCDRDMTHFCVLLLLGK